MDFWSPSEIRKLWREALIKLIESRELRIRMGARGREIVLGGLTSSRMYLQILSVYARLLAGNEPGEST